MRAFTPIYEGFRREIGDELFRRQFSDWSSKQGAHLDQICAPGSGKDVYVVLKAGLVVGFIGFGADLGKETGEIDLNAVDPDHQGQGIGTAMYGFAIAQLKMRGARAVSVSTGGDQAHSPARKAYAKAGFKIGIPSIYYVQAI